MADRFYKDIEIPEKPSSPGTPPTAGFVQLYGRNGRVYMLNSAGIEYDLTLGGGNAFRTIDGGFANSVYLSTQNIDGGFSNSSFSGSTNIDGGGASG